MVYLSIDVEASGPHPGLFSLVSVGAVPVLRRKDVWSVDEGQSFYVELQPLEGAGEQGEATRVHGLTSDYLHANGLPPLEAMQRFDAYVKSVGARTVAAAWPSSFDAPYVGWYCQRFLGYNPLGHSAFDIASYAMGLLRCSRADLKKEMRRAGIAAPPNPNQHNALADAVEQGHLLAQLLNFAAREAR